MDPSTEEGLLDRLRELALSQNWDDVRYSLVTHPELLSRQSIDLLRSVIGQLEQQGEFNHAQAFHRCYELLLQARDKGIEEAIADARGDSGVVSPELQVLMRELSGPEPAPDQLPQRILLIEQALGLADRERSPQIWAALHGMLGNSLLERLDGDRGEHAERALDAYQEALSLLPKATEPVLWAMTSNNLAKAYLRRTHGDRQDNHRQAVAAFRAALSVLTSATGPRILASDSERTLVELSLGSPQDLDRAIEHFHRLLLFLNDVAAKAEGVVDLPQLQRLLRHQPRLETAGGDASTTEPGQASSPIAVEDGGSRSPPDDEAWDRAVVGGRRLAEYWDTGQLDTLLEALELLQAAAASSSTTALDRADVLSLLGKALRAYHDRTRSPEILEQAVSCHQEAVALIGLDSPSRAHYLLDLSADLQERYQHTGEPTDLDEAIDLARQAVALPTAAAEDRPAFLPVLADGLRTRYSDRGDERDLELALATLRQALELTAPASRDRLAVVSGLVATLVVRYHAVGKLEDLNEAIERGREAVADTPAASHERAVVLYGLGRGLDGRYGHTGDVADLDEAIEAYREALAIAPLGSPDRAEMLSSLGTVLNQRYDRTGDVEQLDESIRMWQQAVDLIPASSPERPSALHQLSMGLRDRYYRNGDLVDLDRVIGLSQQAVALTFGTRAEPAYLTVLGTGLLARYERKTDRADLELAIDLWREALDCTPAADPDRPEILRSLGNGLNARYKVTGDTSDLQQSVACWQEAFELTPASSPDRPRHLNSMVAGLMERYQREGDIDALEQAIELARQAVDATLKGTSSWVVYAGNLALALGKRYDRLGLPADLEEAKSLFHEVTSAGLATKLEAALERSLLWGDWAFERRSWAEAAQAFRLAFQAIDGLLRNQLLRAGKETWLGEAQDLPSRAAFALAQIGDLTGAVEFLERGRVRLLAEAQERDRVELERLKDLGHADLYDAFRSAVQQVARLERQHQAEVGVRDDKGIDAALRAAHARVGGATDRIRRVPGYEGLFQSPDIRQIQEILTGRYEEGSSGAVGVYLAVTQPGGLALIVRPGDVQSVWLDLDHDDLVHRLVERRDGRIVGGYLPALFESSRLSATLEELLPWLGAKVLLPVMEALNDQGPAPGSDAPTPVTVVPTGYLGLLPLHAATYQVRGQTRGCLDEWAVTYALSARALGLSRVALSSAPTASSSFLGIANPLPLPTGVPSLTFADVEVREIAEFFGDASRVLRRTEATRAAFERLVATATYVHLACHAQFDPTDPLSSGFILSNGERLRLADLLGLPRLTATRLAVLSACQTAVSDFNNLPEEAIGLPAGFLQTGVAGVVGTLWPVNDISTALLLVKFYELLFEHGPHRPMPPPQALRRAQLWLRSVSNAELTDLFDRYRRTDRGEAGLSPDLARAKYREYALRNPSERPFEHPYHWAPFVFYGS